MDEARRIAQHLLGSGRHGQETLDAMEDILRAAGRLRPNYKWEHDEPGKPRAMVQLITDWQEVPLRAQEATESPDPYGNTQEAEK